MTGPAVSALASPHMVLVAHLHQTGTVGEMRRGVLFVIPPLLAVLGAVVAAVQLAPADERPRAQPSATVPEPSTGEYTSVYPPLGTLGAPLDLPPLDVDLDAMLGKPTDSGMVTGPLWVSGTVVDVSNGVFENETQAEVFERAAACFPPRSQNPTPEMLYTAKNDCFDRLVVAEAAIQRDPSDVFMALRGLSLARPDVFTLCHNASHKVGEVALKRLFAARGADFDGMNRLLLTGAVACQGGLIHGVYDAFGYMDLEVTDFEPAVQACERTPQLTGQCADAVGHASWDAFNEVGTALRACGFWSDESLQQTCAEGIVMRVYQRLEKTDQFYTGRQFGRDADAYMRTTAKMCLEWPSTPVAGITTPDPRTLCYRSIPYLLVKPLFALVETNGAEYQPVRAEAERLVEVLRDTCASYGEYADLCTERIGTYLPGVTVYDEDAALALCTILDRVQAACEAMVRERIERTENGLG